MGGDVVFTRMCKIGLGLLLSGSALMAIFFASAANAAPPVYNLQGTWTSGPLSGGVRSPANGTQTVTQMNMGTGAFSGHSLVEGIAFELSGTESGSAVEFAQTEGSYTAHDKIPALSILPDGNIGGNGNFTDSNGSSGEFWMEVTSSSTGPSPEEVAKKAKEEAEKNAKHPTGTSVVCDYEFATSENTCVASVGDGGSSAPSMPTGSITFTTTSGGFSSGASCSLAPTSGSPSVSNCKLVYQTANSGLPEITATYSGDPTHAGSVGHTQFLGSGSGEGSAETPPGKPGEYPNEVELGLEVPISGTTVEGVAQESAQSPAAVPMTLPPVEGLDPVSAADLKLVETDAKKVDNSGAQNAQDVKELDQSIEKLNQRSVEVTHSTAPAEQAETQKLTKDANETVESISKMLKKQQELELEIIKNARTSAFSAANHKHAKKQKTRTVKPLAHVVERHVAAGKLKLVLKLNHSALNKLAGKRNSLTVLVRVDMLLPSGLYKGGLPRAFVKSIKLKRTVAGKHGAHKKR
jgi:hypothetical protein